MIRFKSHKDAKYFAETRGLCYAVSALCINWTYVGTFKELEDLGCINIMEKPKYKHDCSNCKFLGRFEDHDLYYCNFSNLETIIARYSSNPPDYISGIYAKDYYAELLEAYNRAIKLGYIKQKP